MKVSFSHVFDGAFEPGELRQSGRKVLRPSTTHPVTKHPIWKAVFTCHRRPWSPIGGLHRSSCIEGLIVLGHPSAIIRRVTGIHVFAVNRKAVGIAARLRPLHKRRKCQPLLANFDPAPAIVLKAGSGRIPASTLHRRPDLVNLGARHAMGCSSFFPKTSTGNDAPISKFYPWVDSFVPAGASAKPQGSAARPVSNLPNNRQSSKRLPCDVFAFWVSHKPKLYTALPSSVGTYIAGNVAKKKVVTP